MLEENPINIDDYHQQMMRLHHNIEAHLARLEYSRQCAIRAGDLNEVRRLYWTIYSLGTQQQYGHWKQARRTMATRNRILKYL